VNNSGLYINASHFHALFSSFFYTFPSERRVRFQLHRLCIPRKFCDEFWAKEGRYDNLIRKWIKLKKNIRSFIKY